MLSHMTVIMDLLKSQQDWSGGGQAVGAVLSILYVVLGLFYLIAGWKVYTKANQPGWAIIIPFYNIYVLLKIVGRPEWWLLLFFIPLVNIVISIILMVDLAKSFGKSGGFAAGLILLSFIFWPILGFGSAKYAGPAAK